MTQDENSHFKFCPYWGYFVPAEACDNRIEKGRCEQVEKHKGRGASKTSWKECRKVQKARGQKRIDDEVLAQALTEEEDNG